MSSLSMSWFCIVSYSFFLFSWRKFRSFGSWKQKVKPIFLNCFLTSADLLWWEQSPPMTEKSPFSRKTTVYLVIARSPVPMKPATSAPKGTGRFCEEWKERWIWASIGSIHCGDMKNAYRAHCYLSRRGEELLQSVSRPSRVWKLRYPFLARPFSLPLILSQLGIAFVEFQRVANEGEASSFEVLGIGTCELTFRGGRKLLLHYVWYAPDVRRSLLSVIVLFNLGFRMEFLDGCVNLYLGTDRTLR